MSAIMERLGAIYEAQTDAVEAWFAARRKELPPFVTSSVDLRHADWKLAPVDTNLFPAGFNNLSRAGAARAAARLKDWGTEHYPQAKRLLIVPENHTRNGFYFDNLAALLGIARAAGYEARLGSLIAEDENLALLSNTQGVLEAEPLRRAGPYLQTAGGFKPDLILLNNDLTPGVPSLLQGLAQPVEPPSAFGWHRRRKSVHFAAYDELVRDFAARFGFDPWLLSTCFHQCGMIDFSEQQGIDCLVEGVDEVLGHVRRKYAEYGITEEPYVYIKADSGTYGMGIMTVRSAEELQAINKKTRNKMQVVKEGARVSEVIIQEGVPTIDRVDGKPAEPMVYLVDGIPVGGMYRVNGTRDAFGNLNAAGMEFKGMCDEAEDGQQARVTVKDCNFRAFALVAAIAALAASREEYAEQAEPRKAGCGKG